MTRCVILDLHSQSPRQPIQVFLEIPDTGPGPRWKGSLPARPTLFRLLEQWRSYYRGLAIAYRITIESVDFGASFEAQTEACQSSAQELEQEFQAWLRSEAFQPITDHFREQLLPDEEICLLLRTDEYWLRQLPWQCWDLLKRYKKAEVVLCNPTAERPPKAKQPHKTEQSNVQILAVLGTDNHINIDEDSQFLKTFSPEADTRFLVKPSREKLFDTLWSQPWDIFFFAGHSYTEGQHGVICLNDTDSPLPIAALAQAMEKAIANGLQVAIFNSCDGLGLAQDLEKLHIPHLVVMREPVPDAIAQRFLKNFLGAYSRDIPLHLAVRDARASLVIKETEFPSASHLPILCQNYSATSPTWRSLRTGGRIGGNLINEKLQTRHETKFVAEPPEILALSPSWLRKGMLLLTTSFFVTTFIFVIRWAGWLEPYELNAYDHLMQVQWQTRPEPLDDKLLLVVHDGNEPLPNIQNMEFRGTQSVPDEALDLAVKKLYEKFSPLAIGFMNVQPDQSDNRINEKLYPELVRHLQNGDGNLFTVCMMPTDDNSSKGPILNSYRDHVGLANFLDDNSSRDNILRRQLISNANQNTSECASQLSISALISFFYAQNIQHIEVQQTEEENIDYRQFKFGDRQLPRLNNHAGGYVRSIDANGTYQSLLNYRRTKNLAEPATVISLNQLLTDEIDSERIKAYQNRIILLGSTVSTDPHVTIHTTPYKDSQGERIEIPGLIANAHMISQLIHWIDDDRPLIQWWSAWQEYIWILLWASLASLTTLIRVKPLHISILALLLIVCLSLICSHMLNYGWWIPLVPSAVAILATPVLVVYLSAKFLRRSWKV